jgi:hypothetical protein
VVGVRSGSGADDTEREWWDVNQPERSRKYGGRGRRVSPRTYRFLLTVHLLVSVAWLGIVAAKLMLGIAAVLSDTAVVAMGRFNAMDVLNTAFPPLAIATVISGVALSLGTKWGLLRHYWVATKLALTVGVIGTAVQLGDGLVRAAMTATTGGSAGGDSILDLATAPTTLLIGLSAAHLAMLVLATVLSVHKPWGRTRLGRRPTAVPAPRRALDVGSAERPNMPASSLVR